MEAPPPKILLTGPPRVGKTTCIEKLLERLDLPAAGFFTREVRRDARRVGFDVESLDGRRGTLARLEMPSPWRVGRYGVELASFEAVALAALEAGLASGALLIVDEIGKMELFSDPFKALLTQAVEGPAPLVGTVMVGNPPFVRRLKTHPAVTLIEVTPGNRDGLPEKLASRLAAALNRGGGQVRLRQGLSISPHRVVGRPKVACDPLTPTPPARLKRVTPTPFTSPSTNTRRRPGWPS